VTLGFPPDTDTPGYVEENKDKPEETRLISEASGLQSPECVAKMLMKDCLVRLFFLNFIQ
jgi:3-dehydrosphinganine reductase